MSCITRPLKYLTAAILNFKYISLFLILALYYSLQVLNLASERKEKEREKVREIKRQTDRQTDRQRGEKYRKRERDRQTDREERSQ